MDDEGTIRWYKPNEYIPRGMVRPISVRPDVEELAAATVLGAGSRSPPPPAKAVIRGDAASRLTSWPTSAKGDPPRLLAVQTARNKLFFMYTDSVEEADKWAELIDAITSR
jgi:hypothetical protein